MRSSAGAVAPGAKAGGALDAAGDYVTADPRPPDHFFGGDP